MTLTERLRWTCAYLRYKGDDYLVNHYGAARIVIAVLLLIVLIPIAYKIDGFLAGWYVPVVVESGPQVQKAWVQFIWYIVVLIVAAVIAYAMAPKPPTPEPGKGVVPEATDGKAIIRAYGDVWIDDPMVLGFKTMGADPIKKKGGK